MKREDAVVYNAPSESDPDLPNRLGPEKPEQKMRANGLERWLCRQALEYYSEPSLGFALWDGEQIRTNGNKPNTLLELQDRGALWKLLANPSLNFGDLYSSGRIGIDGSLIRFLEDYYASANRAAGKASLAIQLALKILSRIPVANSLIGSRKNIRHHYDISNDFYKLWLDESYMQYTCAYYANPTMTLEQAQAAKMEHVCRKLRLKPGETVVEAGCGWGGLARYMAKHYGVQVKSYNISREQIRYARSRIKEENLDQLVEYIEDDYRNISGKYDAFVSIGMLEHVGIENFEKFGCVIDRCLKPEGRGLIHSIGRNKPGLVNSWIEKRIFPGAYPPSLKETMDIFEPYSLSVLDIENLRLHYVQTLVDWLERYEDHKSEVEEMYDTEFRRAWRLYLAGSIAAFKMGDLQLFQILFSREENNCLPRTRRHLYSNEDDGNM